MSRGSGRRIVSVDTLRGATVAFMIHLNDPGDTMKGCRVSAHARWRGWTAVDFIFPLFQGKGLRFRLFDGLFGWSSDRRAASAPWAVALLTALTACFMTLDRLRLHTHA